MKGIADTAFIVAFANRGDHNHEWAIEVARRLTPPLATCEAVLAEAGALLGSSSYVLALVDDGLLAVDFELDDELTRVTELASRHRDATLAELCLLRLAELHPGRALLTTDGARFPRTVKRMRVLAPPERHQTKGTSRKRVRRA